MRIILDYLIVLAVIFVLLCVAMRTRRMRKRLEPDEAIVKPNLIIIKHSFDEDPVTPALMTAQPDVALQET